MPQDLQRFDLLKFRRPLGAFPLPPNFNVEAQGCTNEQNKKQRRLPTLELGGGEGRRDQVRTI